MAIFYDYVRNWHLNEKTTFIKSFGLLIKHSLLILLNRKSEIFQKMRQFILRMLEV